MKRIFYLLIAIIAGCNLPSYAQDWKQTKTISVLAPAYLDSVFNNNQYRYGTGYPKFLVPGNDFLNGAAFALDSLATSGVSIKVSFFDAKSTTLPIQKLIDSGRLDKSDLIIGYVKEPEFGELAAFALANKIPFVSANYPNDGGVRLNPFLAILQSTLRSHCQAIHSFIVQNHGNDKIFLVRGAGSQEDKVSEYLKKANEPDGKPLLKIEIIRIDSNFNLLTKRLDSTQNSIIIAGSLDPNFAKRIITILTPLQKKYPLKLIGMPNWEGMEIARKGKVAQMPFYFTSSFYPDKNHSAALFLKKKYKEKFKGLPSESAYRGFEAMFYFAKLLDSFPSNSFSMLGEMEEPLFNGYNFKAIYSQKKNSVPDYYENEHIYLLKSLNGTLIKAW